MVTINIPQRSFIGNRDLTMEFSYSLKVADPYNLAGRDPNQIAIGRLNTSINNLSYIMRSQEDLGSPLIYNPSDLKVGEIANVVNQVCDRVSIDKSNTSSNVTPIQMIAFENPMAENVEFKYGIACCLPRIEESQIRRMGLLLPFEYNPNSTALFLSDGGNIGLPEINEVTRTINYVNQSYLSENKELLIN